MSDCTATCPNKMKADEQYASLSLGEGVAKKPSTCATNIISEDLFIKNINGDIKKSIQLGSQVNITDNQGRSLLHHAVTNGELTVVKALLNAGADVHLADKDGFTALHLAAQYNQEQIAIQLIAAGAIVDARDEQKKTPLHWAAYHGHAGMCIILIRETASLQSFDEQGYTPLYYALQQGNLELVKVIAVSNEHRLNSKRCAAFAYKQMALHKQQQNSTRKNSQNKKKKESPVEHFLEKYEKKLSREKWKEFNENIVPILRKRLSSVQHPLQERVIAYFNNAGYFYPDILQGYDVQDWVYESLILDICKEALTNKDNVLFAKFKKRLLVVISQYQAEEREKLLIAIKEKQLYYWIDLVLICDILTYLAPFKPAQALKLIQLYDSSWLHSLRLAWLNEKVKKLHHFKPSERSQIIYAAAILPFRLELKDRFIAGLKTEKIFQNVKEFFAFITKNSIPENVLITAFYQKPKQEEDSILKTWKAYIAYELLKNKISQLYPEYIEIIEQQILTLLYNHSLYEEVDATLDKLLTSVSADVNDDNEAQCFINVLDLLIEYTVAEPICKQAFVEILQQKPSCVWEKELHTNVIAATFGKSYERSVEEIINYIIEKSPQTFFATNKKELQKSYNELMDSYRSTSRILPEVIAKWNKNDITCWIAQIKGPEATKNMLKITQYEVLAVIIRAVELFHGVVPRATQLLSLLVFMNHADKGCLAQINTGEGKSLIIAMLAAMHALQGKKVDVVTTSTELSIPEVKKQSGFFAMLGLTVGENSDTGMIKEIYQRDIVYGTAGNFQGDILRTEFYGNNIRGNRGFGVVIVDEVDSMLFDSRHAIIRLSAETPAMHHLEILLASIYNQVISIIRHMVERDGSTYYIHEDFEVNGDQIITYSDNPLEPYGPIENKEKFISEVTQKHIEKLLRDLDSDSEAEEWKEYKMLNEKLVRKEFKLSYEENENKRKKMEKDYQQIDEQIKNSSWFKNNRYPVIEIPTHLKEFARKQIPHWIHSAIQAICFYKKELHYVVADGNIVPIDFENTGVLQYNMVWSDGLAQMLQIKEGLRVEPENLSTNFISVPEFYKRYGTSIYGLTGTLGNEPIYQFLSDVYGTDLAIIPPYKHIPITGNTHSRYICKELPAIIAPNTQAWYEAINKTCLSKARNQRAVLIICKYIDHVNKIAMQLQAHYDPAKIFTYTGQIEFNKYHIDSGEIIIATNIAGRGTDITTTDRVEKNGGLHVCITFLPDRYRVELQNAGRTARQGKQGSAQIVLYDHTGANIHELRAKRDVLEENAINSAKNDVKNMLFRDRLFGRFCNLESELLPTTEDCEKIEQREKLESAFESEFTRLKSDGTIDQIYEQYIEQEALKKQAALKTEFLEKLKEALNISIEIQIEISLEEIKQKFYQELNKETFYSHFEESLIDRLCDLSKGEISNDVIECFRNRQTFEAHGKKLASKYRWGMQERKGMEERWGIWLNHALHDNKVIGDAETHKKFDLFASEIRCDAFEDKLIENSYFYVLKGNELISKSEYNLAVNAYNRAILLDPLHSVNARYNKARALLTPKDNKNNLKSASSELKKAKVLLATHYKPYLISFHAIVSQTGNKPELLEHLQYQLDILIMQEKYIDAARSEIKKAQNRNWDLILTKILSLEKVFSDAEPGQNRGPAIRKAKINGLTHMFVVEAREPVSFLSILALFFLGVAQVGAGVFIFACTGGSLGLGLGLIDEGVSDLLASFKAGISGTFSWAQWGMKKALRLAISIVSSGWQSIKDGIKDFTDTVKNISSIGLGITREGMKAAGKHALLALSKGVVKELANCATNYISEELIIKNIENDIEKSIIEKLEERLFSNELITKAFQLDVKNKNNRWQQIFIKEGMKILNQTDSKWMQFLKELVKHGASELGEFISKQTAGELRQIFQVYKMEKLLSDIINMTDNFWEEFTDKIKRKYEKEIDKAIQAQAEQETKTDKGKEEKLESDLVVQLSAPPEEVEGEIKIARVEEGAYHTSKTPATESEIRTYYYGAASTCCFLSKVFAGDLKAKISNKIQGELIQPFTSNLVNMGVENISKDLTENVYISLAGFKVQRNTHTLGNLVATTAQDEKQSGEDTEKPLDQFCLLKVLDIADGKPGDITDVAFIAKTINRPIIIYKNGKVFDIIGKNLPGEPISLSHSSDGEGHWKPMDKNIQVNVSGRDNCLFDSVVAQLSNEELEKLGIKNGQDLRPHVIKIIQNNPTISQKFLENSVLLDYLKCAATMKGGMEYQVNIGKNPNPLTEANRYYDDDHKERKHAHRAVYVSNKGGNEEDYFILGYYDDKNNFIEQKTEKIIRKKDCVNIYTFRFTETKTSTLGILLIPGDDKNKAIHGFVLEPKGPSTKIENLIQRILPGEFKLIPHSGPKFKNTYKLVNRVVEESRCILFHAGNWFHDSKGCPLLGEDYEYVTFTCPKDSFASGMRVTDNKLIKSGKKVKEVKDFIKEKGYENVRWHIMEYIDTDGKKLK